MQGTEPADGLYVDFEFAENTAVDSGRAVELCYRFGNEPYARHVSTTLQVFGGIAAACELPGALNQSGVPSECVAQGSHRVVGVLDTTLVVQFAGTQFSDASLATVGNAGLTADCEDAHSVLEPLDGEAWSVCDADIADERCEFMSACVASCHPPQVLFRPANSDPLVFDNMQYSQGLGHWVKVDLHRPAFLTGVVMTALEDTGPASFVVEVSSGVGGVWETALKVSSTVDAAGATLLTSDHVFGPMRVVAMLVRVRITGGVSPWLTTLTSLQFRGAFVNLTTAVDRACVCGGGSVSSNRARSHFP